MVFYSYDFEKNNTLYGTIYVASGATVFVELFVLISFWRQLCRDNRKSSNPNDYNYSSDSSSRCCCSCTIWNILSIRTLSLCAMISALITICCAALGVHLDELEMLTTASCFEVIFILFFLTVYILRLHETFDNSIYKLSRKSIIFYFLSILIIFLLFLAILTIRVIRNEDHSTGLGEDILSSIHWVIVGLIGLSVVFLFNRKLYQLHMSARSSVVYITNPKVSDVGISDGFSNFGNYNNNFNVIHGQSITNNTNNSDLYKGSGDLSNERPFSKKKNKKGNSTSVMLLSSSSEDGGGGMPVYNAQGSLIGSLDRIESERTDPAEQQERIMRSIVKQALLVTIGIVACLLIVVTSIDWLFIDKHLLLVAYEFVFLHCFFQMTIIITLWLSFSFTKNYYNCCCKCCENCVTNCCSNWTEKNMAKQKRKTQNSEYHELEEI